MGPCDAGFHLLQLGRDEPFGVGQRLLADPAEPFEVLANGARAAALALVVVGRLSALRGRDFEVIAKDFVVAHACAADARAFAFTLFESSDPLASVAGQRA